MKSPNTFDFVSFQFYETQSHASYNAFILGTSQMEYATEYLRTLLTKGGDGGIMVKFDDNGEDKDDDEDNNAIINVLTSLGVQTINLINKVVIGLSLH